VQGLVFVERGHREVRHIAMRVLEEGLLQVAWKPRVLKHEDFHEVPIKHEQEGADFDHQENDNEDHWHEEGVVLLVLEAKDHAEEYLALV